MSSSAAFSVLSYELDADGQVAIITLRRPKAANALNAQLIDELDGALDLAEADDDVRVVILAGEGKHFCAGHDLKELFEATEPWAAMRATPEGKLHHEQVMYWDRCLRLHDFPKPTIAAVQGACSAAGLMLACMCDLIVAADDARFSNPVLRMSGAGVELLVEPWELGARKAKEFLLCAETFDATEAERLGLVNQVVPRAELDDADGHHGGQGGAGAAGHRPGGQGLDQCHHRPHGPARLVALPLHGAPVRVQHRHRAGVGRRAGRGRHGPGPRRAGR